MKPHTDKIRFGIVRGISYGLFGKPDGSPQVRSPLRGSGALLAM